MFVVILYIGVEVSEIIIINRCSFGVSVDDCVGECVEYWGLDSFGDVVFWKLLGEQVLEVWKFKGGGSVDLG